VRRLRWQTGRIPFVVAGGRRSFSHFARQRARRDWQDLHGVIGLAARPLPFGILTDKPALIVNGGMSFRSFLEKQFIDVIQWNESKDGVLAIRYPMADMEIQKRRAVDRA
jgi:hypothetical protein